MKKLFFLLILTIALFNTAYAKMPNNLSDKVAASKARLSFSIVGTDGIDYILYIVGENEKHVDKNWFWRQPNVYEKIWQGKHYAHLDKLGDSSAKLHSVNLNMWHSCQIDS